MLNDANADIPINTNPMASPIDFNQLLSEMQKDIDQDNGITNGSRPWGYTAFGSSTLGPGNDLPPYSVAVSEGPLSEMAWRHDYFVARGINDPALLQFADSQFLDDLQKFENTHPEYSKTKLSVIRNAMRLAPLYYKVRKTFK